MMAIIAPGKLQKKIWKFHLFRKNTKISQSNLQGTEKSHFEKILHKITPNIPFQIDVLNSVKSWYFLRNFLALGSPAVARVSIIPDPKISQNLPNSLIFLDKKRAYCTCDFKRSVYLLYVR